MDCEAIDFSAVNFSQTIMISSLKTEYVLAERQVKNEMSVCQLEGLLIRRQFCLYFGNNDCLIYYNNVY